MDEATYCRERCQAQCCVVRLPGEDECRCPRLSADNTCSVYEERFAPEQPELVVVGYVRSKQYRDIEGSPASRPIFCGRILQLYEKGLIPVKVADQCCVIHRELLNENPNQA